MMLLIFSCFPMGIRDKKHIPIHSKMEHAGITFQDMVFFFFGGDVDTC